MRYTLGVAGVAAGLGLVAGLLIGWRTADRPPAPAPEPDAKQPTDQAGAPPKKDGAGQGAEEKGTLIPLSEIYSPTGQRHMTMFTGGSNPESKREFEELSKRLRESLAPITFITASSLTAESALSDTLEVFTRNSPITSAFRRGGDEPVKLWAFVYLGTSGHAPFWEIGEVRQRESELAIGYSSRTSVTGLETKEVPHCYWIPLKTPSPGVFKIRLVKTAPPHLRPTRLIDLGEWDTALVVRTYLSL
jgi:hypothetical protein